jgi:hypothetical protein
MCVGGRVGGSGMQRATTRGCVGGWVGGWVRYATRNNKGVCVCGCGSGMQHATTNLLGQPARLCD